MEYKKKNKKNKKKKTQKGGAKKNISIKKCTMVPLFQEKYEKIGLIDESELVIVCHSRNHPKLSYAKGDKLIKPLGEKVKYVDPYHYKDDNWKQFTDLSKKYIWGWHCPVIPALDSPLIVRPGFTTETLIEILINSYRVLKPGGKLIFARNKNEKKTKNEIVNNLQKFINEIVYYKYDTEESDAILLRNIEKKWIVTVEEDADKFQFNLGYKKYDEPQIHPNLVIFTKI